MTIEFSRITTDPVQGQSSDVEVTRFPFGGAVERDEVAVEQPLEIRLGYTFLGEPAERSVAVTMRTPGDDRQLAAGFLYGESLIESAADIKTIEFCAADSDLGDSNILRVVVEPDVDVDMGSLQRNFYTTSSCGVCGKASIEALSVSSCEFVDTDDLIVSAGLIASLTKNLRDGQSLFARTGGSHAAGLFDADGGLTEIFEDVGRHNAMDKLIGSRLLDEDLPLRHGIVAWSGRASFELIQKALRARVPIVVAVGAPSSLAIELARYFGITLIGFTRESRFNIYTHAHRIDLEDQ